MYLFKNDFCAYFVTCLWIFFRSRVHTCLVAQLCLTRCNPMDGSPPGSSCHGISQARILEWEAVSFSRGSSCPRDWTCISLPAEPPGNFIFTSWATREVLVHVCTHLNRPVSFKMSLSFSSTKVPTLWAGRPTAWSVGNDSRGSVIFSIKSLGASPESVGRSEPGSRTLILSTALSGNLHVVLNVWSGHQSQISGLRGRIGKWVYLWSEGFEGLVTLSSYTLCLSGAKALQRGATTVHLQGKMFLEQQRRISAHCVLGILM